MISQIRLMSLNLSDEKLHPKSSRLSNPLPQRPCAYKTYCLGSSQISRIKTRWTRPSAANSHKYVAEQDQVMWCEFTLSAAAPAVARIPKTSVSSSGLRSLSSTTSLSLPQDNDTSVCLHLLQHLQWPLVQPLLEVHI